METPWLAALAAWVADDEAIVFDPAVERALANTSLDWAGAAIAGTVHPLYHRYIAAFAAAAQPRETSDGVTVAGDARSWPVLEAATANGVVSHLWEFDDVHRTSTMHPGITVYPVVFALAQVQPDITVARMRAAVVAGYEVGTRIGTLLGKQHYATSHTTATAGCFSAAAAAAKMLGLSAEKTLWAFGHAGTQASGLWQFLDDGAVDAKAFHGGSAVRNGMMAAFLAEAGIAGASRILEGPRGMLAAWKLTASGEGLVPAGGLEITRSSIKSWPVCGQMHSLLDAAECLRNGHDFVPKNFSRILLEVPTPLLDIADVKRPTTVSAMKFSTSFCVAVLLSGAKLPFAGFDESLLENTEVQTLADRIEVVADPAFDLRFPKERPARITIWTADGEVLREERSFRRGDPEAPWQWAPLVERFRGIAGLASLTAANQDAVAAWCAAFAKGEADLSVMAKTILRP